VCGNGGGGGVGTVVVEVVAWKHSDLSVDVKIRGQMSKKVMLSPREERSRGVERRVCQCSFDSKTQVNEL
jgi:hypothetical protein